MRGGDGQPGRTGSSGGEGPSDLLARLIEGAPDGFADPADDYLTVRAKMAPLHGHPVSEGTAVAPHQRGGVGGVLVSRPEMVAPDGDRSPTVLFCHGGAFVSCRAVEYGFYAELASAALGLPVFVVDYRLAPEHRFPAALDDCLAAYRAMVADGPVVCMGDSCGGGMALATVFRARDEGVPMPTALVSLSGWLDLADPGYSPGYAGRRDPFVDPDWLRQRARDYMGPDGDPAQPLASPANGDPSGLPPTLLQVAEVDVGRRGAERFTARAAGVGSPVSLDVAPHTVHGFQGVAFLPETHATWARIGEFVRRAGADGARPGSSDRAERQ